MACYWEPAESTFVGAVVALTFKIHQIEPIAG